MVSAKKQTTEADVRMRIQDALAWEETYTRAAEEGVYFGLFLTWEQREIARERAEDIAYEIRRLQRALREMEKSA